MAVGAMLSGMGSSILGNPKKALLILHKNSPDEVDSAKIAEKTSAILNSPAGISAGPAALGLLFGGSFHVLQVQYNPSSIKLQANADTVPFQYLQGNVDTGIPNQSQRPPSVVLSVELIFDAVNVKDAFMLEKFRVSSGDIAAGAAYIVRSLRGGYTVQPQTNGLIAMLMRDSTRTVTFKWADMTFTGEATEVQAKYTMFSVSGKPVRSVVTLNITQQVDSNADSAYWNKALDKFLAMDSGKGIGQMAGNLLNIAF